MLLAFWALAFPFAGHGSSQLQPWNKPTLHPGLLRVIRKFTLVSGHGVPPCGSPRTTRTLKRANYSVYDCGLHMPKVGRFTCSFYHWSFRFLSPLAAVLSSSDPTTAVHAHLVITRTVALSSPEECASLAQVSGSRFPGRELSSFTLPTLDILHTQKFAAVVDLKKVNPPPANPSPVLPPAG